MTQRPRGREDMDCPFHKKPMSKVCHKCPMWLQIRGANPQSGDEMEDEWICGFVAGPMMQMETIKQLRVNVAKADKLHTAIDEFHKNMAKQNLVTAKLMLEDKR